MLFAWLMRHAIAAVLLSAVSLAPSVAAAGPLTAGVNLGLSHSELDADQGVEPSRTVGLFGRLAFNRRISGQVEVSRVAESIFVSYPRPRVLPVHRSYML